MEGLLDLGDSEHLLLLLRLQHTLYTVLDIVDTVIDDGVETYLYALPVGSLAGFYGRAHLETDDHGVGSLGEQHVGLGDSSHGLVYHVHLDLLGGELDERVGESLDRTVHVTLDDDVELLEVADSDTAAYLLECHVLLGLDALDAQQLLAFVGDALGLLLVGEHIELLACGRGSVESEYGHGRRRAGLGNFLAALVEHRLHLAVAASAQHHVAELESTLLHEHRGEIAAALVERRLYDRTYRRLVRICLELQDVRLEQHLVEQLVDIQSLLRGNLLALVLASPVFHEDIHLGQLAAYLVGICSRLVYLVNREHHGHVRSLSVVDSLYGLGHHGVVGGDDYYRKVGELCASGTHGSEGLVSRSVEEGDAAAVGQLHVIGTDVLGYASRLAGNHVGLAYVVEQRGLAVVDMTHDGNYRRPRKQVFRPVHLLGAAYLLGEVRSDELDLVAELLRHEHERLGIEPLVY